MVGALCFSPFGLVWVCGTIIMVGGLPSLPFGIWCGSEFGCGNARRCWRPTHHGGGRRKGNRDYILLLCIPLYKHTCKIHIRARVYIYIYIHVDIRNFTVVRSSPPGRQWHPPTCKGSLKRTNTILCIAYSSPRPLQQRRSSEDRSPALVPHTRGGTRRRVHIPRP